jgi:transcription-repair coupling factor (superfamily II helicase)
VSDKLTCRILFSTQRISSIKPFNPASMRTIANHSCTVTRTYNQILRTNMEQKQSIAKEIADRIIEKPELLKIEEQAQVVRNLGGCGPMDFEKDTAHILKIPYQQFSVVRNKLQSLVDCWDVIMADKKEYDASNERASLPSGLSSQQLDWLFRPLYLRSHMGTISTTPVSMKRSIEADNEPEGKRVSPSSKEDIRSDAKGSSAAKTNDAREAGEEEHGEGGSD